MTADHLTADQRAASTLSLGEHADWELGTDIATARTGILLTQRAMTSPQWPEILAGSWDCVAELREPAPTGSPGQV